jgi:CheY-like chemotaxis protein
MMGTATVNWRDTQRIVLGAEHSMRPRVLVVDDDPDLCEMMAHLLTGEGFATEVASNGQDALDKAHANPPQVILLDMMMPVMDGWTFLAHQRNDAALAVIPVIVLSAGASGAVGGRPCSRHPAEAVRPQRAPRDPSCPLLKK